MDEELNSSYQKLLPKVAHAVVKASGIALSWVGSARPGVRRKSQGNFVTVCDVAIERELRATLGSILPQADFVGEEDEEPGAVVQTFDESGLGSNMTAWDSRMSAEADSAPQACWVVDPIDGTGNFLNGLEYAISVALQVDGETQVGVVYAPPEDQLFFAAKALGAYRLDGARAQVGESHTEPTRIVEVSQRLRVAPVEDSEEGIVIFGMPYDRVKAHRSFQVAETLYPLASDMKRMGPASLDICRVASSQAKLYVELDLHPWDYAAGALVLKEAGGDMLAVGDLTMFGQKQTIAQAVGCLRKADLLDDGVSAAG